MSYPDIPRFATSWACTYSEKVYLFETFFKRKQLHNLWCRRNTGKVRAKQDSYRAKHGFRSMISLQGDPKDDAFGMIKSLEWEVAFAVEQKSPLELLMEKEERELAA